MRNNPSGVLLITPESLEATFVNRGSTVPKMLAGLSYIVVDEMHSFMATPRGAQLQSLLNRVEFAIRRSPPRIGLSATLGDMSRTAEFLRPAQPRSVTIIESSQDARALQLQVRGYVQSDPAMSRAQARSVEAAGGDVTIEDTTAGDQLEIADHLFRHLRGADNLAFANSRRSVELFADLLARRSATEHVPNEFWPHHGSLSKDMRETVEAQLKDRTRPTTAICTSTLEMGIDIGSVASIAQIGPPPTVAALRQRLGRSGRRDEPSVIRLYISEPDAEPVSHPVDQLRCDLVQTVAMVQLMLDRWVETPDDPGFNYSTLIQQTLSMIAQHGGVNAADLHRVLCGPGPFALVDQHRYIELLRSMSAHDLIAQADDGLLLHGGAGERRINHYSFYTAFQTEQEWRLVTGGRTLGTMPISQPLYDGVLLIFAGKRWKVVSIDTASRVVDLAPSSGGTLPMFGGGGAVVSNEVRARMLDVYRSDDTPPWLDRTAAELLRQGRAAFQRLDLDQSSVLMSAEGSLLFAWTGDRALFTAALLCQREGVEASVEGPCVQLIGPTGDELAGMLEGMCASPPLDPTELAAGIHKRDIDKWDWVLGDELVNEANAARLLDIDGARSIIDVAHRDIPSLVATAAPALPPSIPPPSPTDRPQQSSVTHPREPADQVFQLRRAELRAHQFCVIDVETTGFSPRLGDRVLEVAAVRMRGDGSVLREWSTLVNPERDVSATQIHGITAGDVIDAPAFAAIAGDLLHHMRDAVVVAHNYRFDRDFLAAEFNRADLALPAFPAVCTLSLGALVHSGGVSRRLADCCRQLGVDLTDEHDALEDARATAAVLAKYLQMAVETGCRSLADIGCVPLDWPDDVPALSPSHQSHRRGAGVARVGEQADYLAGLVARLDTSPHVDPDTAAYLDMLDRALEDRRLSDLESAALADTASRWGLTADRVQAAHEHYFESVLDAAVADGIITELEYRDLLLVAELLRLDRDTVERQINDVELADQDHIDRVSSESARPLFAGMSVCFTGALRGRIDGEPITRELAHEFAERAGMIVKKNVSKGLDLLVVADPDSLSGKAEKARSYGTRILAEQVLWSAIGVTTD